MKCPLFSCDGKLFKLEVLGYSFRCNHFSIPRPRIYLQIQLVKLSFHFIFPQFPLINRKTIGGFVDHSYWCNVSLCHYLKAKILYIFIYFQGTELQNGFESGSLRGKGHHRHRVDTTLGRRGCTTNNTTNHHARRRLRKENQTIWEPRERKEKRKDDAATVVTSNLLQIFYHHIREWLP